MKGPGQMFKLRKMRNWSGVCVQEASRLKCTCGQHSQREGPSALSLEPETQVRMNLSPYEPMPSTTNDGRGRHRQQHSADTVQLAGTNARPNLCATLLAASMPTAMPDMNTVARPAPPGSRATHTIAHAARWPHFRRKRHDDPERSRSPIAAERLRPTGGLHDSEREIGGLLPECCLAIRQKRSAPLCADLRTWTETERWRLSGKSDPGMALHDALACRLALTRFGSDGRLATDSSEADQKGVRWAAFPSNAERARRGIAVTRKNFLFLGSDRGGRRAAIIHTVLGTARLNGFDPGGWFADVPDRLVCGRGQRCID